MVSDDKTSSATEIKQSSFTFSPSRLSPSRPRNSAGAASDTIIAWPDKNDGKRQRHRSPAGRMVRIERYNSGISLRRGMKSAAAGSNGIAVRRATTRSLADEASDSDGESLPLLDSTAAYGALLGALCAPRTHHRSAAGLAGGKRLRDDAQAAGVAENLKRRSATAISEVAAYQTGDNEGARRDAVVSEDLLSAQPKSGASVAAGKVSEQTDEPLESAASDRTADSARESRIGGAAKNVQTRACANVNGSGGGSGWRLSLPEEGTQNDNHIEGLQPGEEDDMSTQDFIDAHFERCAMSHLS